MRAKLTAILKDLVVAYDNAAEEQIKANALVLIQTAEVNLINLNQIELGKIQLEIAKLELADAKENGVRRD